MGLFWVVLLVYLWVVGGFFCCLFYGWFSCFLIVFEEIGCGGLVGISCLGDCMFVGCLGSWLLFGLGCV